MPIHNNDISETFDKIADLLEIKGANQFRIRAYRNAARTAGGLSQNISDMVKQNKDLKTISGIGKDLAQKIKEIVTTGKLSFLDNLKKDMPSELSQLMDIAGLGPKRVKIIYEKLDIKNLQDLKKAARNQKIRKLPGFGAKTEASILDGIDQVKQNKKRLILPVAEQYAQTLVEYLKKDKSVKSIDIAGSYRRQIETIGDLDILVTCHKGSNIVERFVKYEDVQKIISKGNTRSSVILRSGLQVDLRIVPQKSYGAALHYFTGSKTHNIAIRKMGIKKKLKINEYGVYRGKKCIGGKTEKEIFKCVDLPYIEPELRENRGEIEAAKKSKLPQLITIEDLKGDLHTHTKATDGHNTLEEMADEAKRKGYEYFANTEHSQHLTVAKGFDPKRLAKHIKKIDTLNKKLSGIVILKSIEVDILEDGSLDLPDDILKELDIVVGAIHSKFNLSENKQTKRILKAMDNPYFNILAHPTGRGINGRPPYDVNMEKIIKAAKQRHCFLELNAQPERLDINDIHCKMTKEMGVKIAISTDAHSIDDFRLIKYGIGQARRGWIKKNDVINTRSLNELKKLLKK